MTLARPPGHGRLSARSSPPWPAEEARFSHLRHRARRARRPPSQARCPRPRSRSQRRHHHEDRRLGVPRKEPYERTPSSRCPDRDARAPSTDRLHRPRLRPGPPPAGATKAARGRIPHRCRVADTPYRYRLLHVQPPRSRRSRASAAGLYRSRLTSATGWRARSRVDRGCWLRGSQGAGSDGFGVTRRAGVPRERCDAFAGRGGRRPRWRRGANQGRQRRSVPATTPDRGSRRCDRRTLGRPHDRERRPGGYPARVGGPGARSPASARCAAHRHRSSRATAARRGPGAATAPPGQGRSPGARRPTATAARSRRVGTRSIRRTLTIAGGTLPEAGGVNAAWLRRSAVPGGAPGRSTMPATLRVVSGATRCAPSKVRSAPCPIPEFTPRLGITAIPTTRYVADAPPPSSTRSSPMRRSRWPAVSRPSATSSAVVGARPERTRGTSPPRTDSTPTSSTVASPLRAVPAPSSINPSMSWSRSSADLRSVGAGNQPLPSMRWKLFP